MTNEYVLATNDDGELAVRTVNATESSSVTSTNDIITRTEDGKLAVRVVGAGGGGDSHNKGYFANQAALEEAYPTAEAGDYAVVGDTDTIWIWDTDDSAWVDSDTKGQVTSVNNQTGAVTIGANDILPSQTGNSGKFLTTDGTDASWSDKPLVNTATGASAVGIIGQSSSVGSVGIGLQCSASGNGTVAIGWGATTSAYGALALGGSAKATASGAIQLNGGAGGNVSVNNDANTFKVANQNGNYEIMSADGTIPTDRFTTTPSADGTYYATLSISSGTATRSWGTINALVNKATGTNSLSILGNAVSSVYGVAVGAGATVTGNFGTAIGGYLTDSAGGVAIGYNTHSSGSGVAIGGENTRAEGTNRIAIGYRMQSNADNAIQIGGNGNTQTNSDANTFKVANANGNFEIMSADGTVPTARLTKVNTTATLAVADWSSSTQTVTVSGVKADSVVFVSPDPTSASDYASAGILCTAQATDSLTFTCTTTPTNAITVNVICL